MIIEPSNYTYETMPDYTDAVDGAVEIPVTGEEMEIRYAHEVVYDEDVPDGRFFRRTGFFRCRHDRKERKT